MLRRTLVPATTFVVLSLLASGGAAAVGVQRTFVASTGNDTNPCSIALPCRGFAAALAQTASGGEIIVLDSAGYGPVTITQAVSIIAPAGLYAGITVLSGDGVTVSAGASDKVVLRGLTINGQGGTNGVRVTSGGVTHIEDCTIAKMGDIGISVEGGATVNMARIVVRGNGGQGVQVAPSAATTIKVTLADSMLISNGGSGFAATMPVVGPTINAALTRVTASNNASQGFAATSGSVGTITMTVADSIAVENGSTGVFVVGTNATAIVSGSSLVHNPTADLYQSVSAVLRTAGNNALTGRGAADIFGTVTSNPLK